MRVIRRVCGAAAAMIVIAGASSFSLRAQPSPAQNIIVVTLDGVRWQELFAGRDRCFATPRPMLRGW